jgi:site-specific DNA-methyltransferase (adenine-specific)/adenine-specific DNA-methyltransferase
VGKEAEDLCRHDKWLCMMYPRLALLREFLRDDGAIFVSIDDNEVASLRSLMDEVFGRDRFVACFVWQKRYSRENREAIGDAHEYLLCFVSDVERFKLTRNRVPLGDKQRKLYKNPDNDPNGPWQSISMTAQGWRPNQMYEIVAPNGRKHQPPEGRCWSTIESEFLRLSSEGKIYWGANGNGVPRIKLHLKNADGLVPWTWLPHEEVGHTGESRIEIRELLGTQTAFDTPKPTRLIERVIQIATDRDFLILDSFAGSGTTAHAILKQNSRDGGNRRCILVELDPGIVKDVTRQRLERVCNGYTDAKGNAVAGLGSGFRYCRLGRTLLDEQGNINGDVPFADLARYVYLLETGVPVPTRPRKDCPLLGVHHGRAVYLLYNGVLGDRRPAGGNVLTNAVLSALPPHPDGSGPRIVYGEACRLSDATLTREGVTFRQIPYSLRET